jgi:hypothetical protein
VRGFSVEVDVDVVAFAARVLLEPGGRDMVAIELARKSEPRVIGGR